jgi:hypothetical protein
MIEVEDNFLYHVVDGRLKGHTRAVKIDTTHVIGPGRTFTVESDPNFIDKQVMRLNGVRVDSEELLSDAIALTRVFGFEGNSENTLGFGIHPFDLVDVSALEVLYGECGAELFEIIINLFHIHSFCLCDKFKKLWIEND